MENPSDLQFLDLQKPNSLKYRRNLFPGADQSVQRTYGTRFRPLASEFHGKNGFSQQPKYLDFTTGNLTDEDLEELKGCIELGFGFGLDEDQRLCETFPALNMYYAINRGDFDSGSSQSFGFPAPTSAGNKSELMKTRLKHWAQIVACSVKQSSSFAKLEL